MSAVSEVCLREALRNEQSRTTRIASYLYSGGGYFEAQLGNRINLPRVSVVFLDSPSTNSVSSLTGLPFPST